MCHLDPEVLRPHYKVAPRCDLCRFKTIRFSESSHGYPENICNYGDMMTFVVDRDCVCDLFQSK